MEELQACACIVEELQACSCIVEELQACACMVKELQACACIVQCMLFVSQQVAKKSTMSRPIVNAEAGKKDAVSGRLVTIRKDENAMKLVEHVYKCAIICAKPDDISEKEGTTP